MNKLDFALTIKNRLISPKKIINPISFIEKALAQLEGAKY